MDERCLTVIVPAAGAGKRLGAGMNKAFVKLRGVPLLVHCLRMLAATALVREVLVVVAPGEEPEAAALVARYGGPQLAELPVRYVAGGAERVDSVANALACVNVTNGYVAVHDGARPFAGRDVFLRTLAAAQRKGAAIAAVPVKNTIKVVDADGTVVDTPLRSSLVAVQTPQIFEVNLLRRAYAFYAENRSVVTDDASLVEGLGVPVAVAQGDYTNIKVTTPEDLVMAERLLEKAEAAPLDAPAMETQDGVTARREGTMEFRIGTGFDVHQLQLGRKCIIGGVEIPYQRGLLGHSDADVALHALMDALLGAAALGDIGKHFPDTDARYAGADSRQLLRAVRELLAEAGWRPNNVDVTVIAQAPKLAPYIPQMRENIAADLQLPVDAVSVKATTTEKLGFTGRGEGIAAEAVASLVR